MCNLTFKDGKMLSFYRKIDSLSTVLNEFEMHSAYKVIQKLQAWNRKVRTFTFLGLGTLANFTIFRYLLTIFDYLSLALSYILQIWLSGLSLIIFTGLANSTTLHNWVLGILASLHIPSFPFLL